MLLDIPTPLVLKSSSMELEPLWEEVTTEGTIALGNVSIGQSFRLRQFTNSNGNVYGSAFSTDGKYFYQVDTNRDRVFRYELVKTMEYQFHEDGYDPAVVGYATTSTGGTIGVKNLLCRKSRWKSKSINFQP